MAETLVRKSLQALIDKHRRLPEYNIGLAVWFNKKTASERVAYLLEVAPRFGYLEMVHEQENSYGLGAIKTLRHWMVSADKLEEILDPANEAHRELREMILTDHEALSVDVSRLGPRAVELFGKGYALPENAVEAWYLPAQELAEHREGKGDHVLGGYADGSEAATRTGEVSP